VAEELVLVKMAGVEPPINKLMSEEEPVGILVEGTERFVEVVAFREVVIELVFVEIKGANAGHAVARGHISVRLSQSIVYLPRLRGNGNHSTRRRKLGVEIINENYFEYARVDAKGCTVVGCGERIIPENQGVIGIEGKCICNERIMCIRKFDSK
jgi:hypothetical protein